MKTSIRKLTSQYLEPAKFIFLIFILQYLEPTGAVGRADQVGNETDHAALLAIRSQLTDPPAGIFSSWNQSIHHCYWQGVTCGHGNNQLTVLDLSSSGLVGTISPFIGNLSFLQVIDLSNNSLAGQIPPEIGRLLNLQVLRLFDNTLDGTLPANLSACIRLKTLAVGDNHLEGKLPMELAELSKLTSLSVYSNKFTGPIFKVITNLTSLEFINLAYNSFTGNIPSSIAKMRNLKDLIVVGNELSGTIPASILNCSMLINLSVGDNNLHGELPKDIGLRLPHLVVLDVFSNQFSGAFPYSVFNLTGLQNLDLNTNNFVGRVPHDIGRLHNLSFLGLAINHLEGDINFVSSLVNCSNLEILELSGNEFTGILPVSIANLSTNLQTFYLELNNIRGEIPAGIANLMSLQLLTFAQNEITGNIPHDLGKLQNLEFLDFSSNRLKGIIPDTFKNLSRLSELYLTDNQLEGNIPPSLGGCKSLLDLKLSSNHLHGTLADELFKGPAMFTILDLSNNLLEGSIPLEISKQTNLVKFNVSENKLSGVLPYGLGDCSELLTLDVHANNFQGHIPSSFSSLGNLQTVDFSRNNLSGTIPNYFSKFPLQMLNLSYNSFEGEVPTKGIFANTSAIAIDGNSKFCGGIPKLHLPRCMQPKEMKKGRSMTHTLKLIVPILCAFVVVLVIVIWLYLTYYRKKRVPDSSHSSGKAFMKVSYDMLLKATNGFSKENLIGSGGFGSVFRGNLDGTTIAVKVLNLHSRGASKSFMSECNTLRNVRHRNLVGITTTCSSIDFKRNDFKALVYEFMPNGNLDDWIHGKGAKRPTLLQRLDIAIDVAHALSYLHHDCEIPIVHCDLKPSNILLDNDMVARVGDFGLAKFLAQPRHPDQSCSTGIRGTIGYIAPEYGLGNEPSPNSDVYSYGILVLELMTGKRPTDNIFQEEFNLQIYAEGALPGNVLDIIDPNLEDNEMTEKVDDLRAIQAIPHRQVECMKSLINVGLSCSKHLPQDRMKISDAISKLRVARDGLGNARQVV
ncbi:uncharacterized protein LOC141654900 [Silene latifolia]|uniref:uncharacterized protein LOC141654900 n=1 Tax=Silene latifolia TaxID=37657 RepID=UPI003D77A194